MGIDDRQLSGSVERITFYNPDNGYTVLRLQPDSRAMLPYQYAAADALATVVGHLPEVSPGEWLKLGGQWSRHLKHGWQFEAQQCEQGLPATLEGIKRYLGSGLVRGVGKVMAERIVNVFGEQTLEVIEHQPQRLRQVLGIGPQRVDNITHAWEEQRAIKDIMLFLQSHAISTTLAVKIYKQYGEQALAVVRQTPYKLVQDIHGVGFKTADKIAQAMGLAHDDPGRIEAGIAYTLNRLAEEGHVYVPQDELEPEAAEILGVDPQQVTTVIEHLETNALIKRDTLRYATETTADTHVIQEEQAVYLTPFYYSEIGVTHRLQRLLHHPTSRVRTAWRAPQDVEAALRWAESRSQLELAAQQRQAILTALQHKVSILTGGPGTGKTTALRTLLDVLDQAQRTYALASPTGRAAKRLAEATGRPAKTVHRLLEFQPGSGFGRNENNPLEADMVIVDEASMLDLVLTNNLLKAVGLDSHLLLVGDIDQLPSVGAGNVLRDLIASGIVAVTRLEVIFRQAAGSLIIQNAHRINQGLLPITHPQAQDFFIFVKKEMEGLPELLVDIVTRRIPDKFGIDPLDDIQVLAPMYQGAVGVAQLNQLLQAALNPPGGHKPERRLGGRLFRAGDKVMQTVNNYDKNIYNGDIGRINRIDLVQQQLIVNLDGAPVVYDFLEADELIHAYAISVHKAQGSEYPCVVMPMVTQHYLMLQRNLVYTAITRAQKLVILVGSRQAITMAVKNDRTTQRYSGLHVRLAPPTP